MTSTNISDEKLDKLRIILVTRYRIVMALYPDEKLTPAELAKKSGTDRGNLSRYLSEMLEKGILVPEKEQSKSSNRNNVIRLSDETRHIINQFKPFLYEDYENYKELDDDLGEKLVELIWNQETRSMAADEVQRISRQYKLGPSSELLRELVILVVDDDIRNVRHVLLYSIRNFVQKLDKEARDKAQDTLYDSLDTIVKSDDNSDGGNRDRNIVLEIFDYLGLMSFTFEGLYKEFYDAISLNQHQESQVRAERIIKRFPDMVPRFRLSLIERYGSVDEEQKRIIESILNKTPLS